MKIKKCKKNNNQKPLIPFHYDDKGRRIFDYNKSEIIKEKEEQKQRRTDSLIKNLINENSQFRCEKCNMNFTDNSSYQEHINGKKHNLTIGNTLIIKNSNVNDIRAKLLSKKRDRLKNIKNKDNSCDIYKDIIEFAKNNDKKEEKHELDKNEEKLINESKEEGNDFLNKEK